MTFVKTILCFSLVVISAFCSAQNSYQKTGTASFYADKFNGRRTSSGEMFSQKKMTCAHRTLPLGTRLKVTNLDNNKSVIVVVNDRGPFKKDRVIDVTLAAAKKLDFIKDGEANVSLEILDNEGKGETELVTTDSLRPFYKIECLEGIKGYSVKVASYLSEEKTFEVVKELKAQTGEEVFVQSIWHHKHFMYRIFVGKYKQRDNAEELQQKLRELYADCYVVELMQ